MKLQATERDSLPTTAFALPGRRFPIHDEAHARAALRMLGHATPAEQRLIRAKVQARYPDIGKEKTAAVYRSSDLLARSKAAAPPETPATPHSKVRALLKMGPAAGALAGLAIRARQGGGPGVTRRLVEGAAEGAGLGWLPSVGVEGVEAVREFRQPQMKKTAAEEPTGRNVSAISGAALGGGAAQHLLPAVGAKGMTHFRRGAAVAALIGTGNLAGRSLYDKAKRKPDSEKTAELSPLKAAILAGLATGALTHAGIEILVGPEGRQQMREERRDPRLYSNLRGMVRGESPAQRVAAHRGLAKSDGTILGAMRNGFGRHAETSKVAEAQRVLNGAKLLREFGPPVEWSGFVAGSLGPDRRAAIQAHWKTLTPTQRAKAKADFSASFSRKFGL